MTYSAVFDAAAAMPESSFFDPTVSPIGPSQTYPSPPHTHLIGTGMGMLPHPSLGTAPAGGLGSPAMAGFGTTYSSESSAGSSPDAVPLLPIGWSTSSEYSYSTSPQFANPWNSIGDEGPAGPSTLHMTLPPSALSGAGSLGVTGLVIPHGAGLISSSALRRASPSSSAPLRLSDVAEDKGDVRSVRSMSNAYSAFSPQSHLSPPMYRTGVAPSSSSHSSASGPSPRHHPYGSSSTEVESMSAGGKRDVGSVQDDAADSYAAPPQPHRSGRLGVKRRQKYTRSRTGCLGCRARRIKCDEGRPVCRRCHVAKRECQFPEPSDGRKAKPKGNNSGEEEDSGDKGSTEDSVEPLSSHEHEHEHDPLEFPGFHVGFHDGYAAQPHVQQAQHHQQPMAWGSFSSDSGVSSTTLFDGTAPPLAQSHPHSHSHSHSHSHPHPHSHSHTHSHSHSHHHNIQHHHLHPQPHHQQGPEGLEFVISGAAYGHLDEFSPYHQQHKAQLLAAQSGVFPFSW